MSLLLPNLDIFIAIPKFPAQSDHAKKICQDIEVIDGLFYRKTLAVRIVTDHLCP